MIRRVAAALLLALAATPSAFAEGTVVVPKRVIYPGELVSDAMVSVVALNRSRASVPDIVFSVQEITGKVTKRTLLPGRLIPLGYLRDAYTVEAGKPVTVMLIGNGLEISLTGVPLQPGAVGEVIRVRNVDSGATLTGTVMADGTVRVGAT